MIVQLMNPNEAPTDVLPKSRLFTIILGMGFVCFLALAFNRSVEGGYKGLLLLGAGAFLVYLLFFEIQTVEIFRTHISIKYLCRKVRVEHADIDFVSLEQVTRKGVTSHYVLVKLRSGRKITLGNLRESIDEVYEKSKACASTNEEFLAGR
jgi:hypothetical protein